MLQAARQALNHYHQNAKKANQTKHANPVPSVVSKDVGTCLATPWSEEAMQTCTSTACLGHSVTMLNLLPLVVQPIWSMSFPRSLIGIYGTTCAAWDQFPATPGFQYCPPGTEPRSDLMVSSTDRLHFATYDSMIFLMPPQWSETEDWCHSSGNWCQLPWCCLVGSTWCQSSVFWTTSQVSISCTWTWSTIANTFIAS